MKFEEAASNFKKFVGLANNFWKVLKTPKNSMKFVDWKVGFKCLEVFLYLSFICLNILLGKQIGFMNTFNVSWILFTNEYMSEYTLYMSGQNIWYYLKVLVCWVRQVVVLSSVNTTKYYLDGLVSGRYGEVIFKTDSTVLLLKQSYSK